MTFTVVEIFNFQLLYDFIKHTKEERERETETERERGGGGGRGERENKETK